MIILKEEDKKQIKSRINDLSPIARNQNFIVLLFEGLGTLILAYGICVSQFTHPISRGIPNPYWTFLISCFLYFGIAVSAPFTGGHLNPSVTIGTTFAGLSKSKNIIKYILSQLIGAFAGVLIYYLFLVLPSSHSEVKLAPPQIYSQAVDSRQILLDALSEAVGTFIFLFGIIYTCKRNYMNGQYFKYFFIALMLLMGRTFTFRKGCLNPAVGLVLQFFAAFNHGDISLFLSVFGICFGSIMGAILAAWFYNKFYEPLLNELQKCQ